MTQLDNKCLQLHKLIGSGGGLEDSSAGFREHAAVWRWGGPNLSKFKCSIESNFKKVFAFKVQDWRSIHELLYVSLLKEKE